MLLRSVCSSLILALLVPVASGCGGSAAKPPEEKIVPASGVVQLDGKPAAGIRLRLTPASDGPKTVGGAYAITKDDGKFTVIHWSNKEGVVPGAYVVTFSKMVKPDGSPLGENDSPAMVNARETIAPAWADVNGDRNSAASRRLEIPASGKTDIQFSITSAPARS